jgi:hypothetical protein
MKKQKKTKDLIPDEKNLEEKYGWIEDDLEEEVEEEKKSKMVVHPDEIKDVFRQKAKRIKE